MRLIATAALAAFATVSVASAQTSTTVTTTGPAASSSVVISPEEETTVTRYVTERKISSVNVPNMTTVEVGAELPSSVELHTVPNVKYRTAVVSGRTVLVDPGTRKVVRVIQTR